MKKLIFAGIFVGIQLCFICIHIDKQTRLVKLSYQKQKYEQASKTLKLKKQLITATLHGLKNHQDIKTYAQNELGMTPLFLKNIKKLSSTESTHE